MSTSDDIKDNSRMTTNTHEDVINDDGQQQDEINSLRDHFKDNIRILSSIGEFSYILKIFDFQYHCGGERYQLRDLIFFMFHFLIHLTLFITKETMQLVCEFL